MNYFFLWDHLLYHCVLPLLGILELSKKGRSGYFSWVGC